MNWYDRVVLPYVIDMACGLPMVQQQRRQLLPQAQGRVLEVGMGTGRNLPFYDRSRITRLVGVDPALQMHRLAQKRSRDAGIAVELMGLSAEQLPTADASFDTVVCTYTLCSIPDAAQALREMRRVLVPGGQLLFCEHGRAPDANVRRWLRALAAPLGAAGRRLSAGARHPRLAARSGLCRPNPIGLSGRAATHDFSLLGAGASGLNHRIPDNPCHEIPHCRR